MLKYTKNALSKMPKKAKSIGLIAFGVVLGSTAVGFAAIPDANGVITGCNSAGLNAKLRLIDTATTPNCNATETKVTWNQKGLKGDTGAQGLVGPQGPQGPATFQRAIVRLNTTGTLDANFSRGVADYKLVKYPSSVEPYNLIACVKLSFEPKLVLTGFYGGQGAPAFEIRNQIFGAESLDVFCGTDFNAYTNLGSSDIISPDFSGVVAGFID